MKPTELPKHLGGHANTTHLDLGAILALKDLLKIKSVLDIGCGPGGMKKMCESIGLEWTGIDGDWTVANQETVVHDFTKGQVDLGKRFSLAWSVEFLEHVEEAYLENVFSAFSACDSAFVTHAPKGKTGHHHVNCQPKEYWVEKFQDYGFELEEDLTKYVRERSTMRREFVRNTGLAFIKTHP